MTMRLSATCQKKGRALSAPRRRVELVQDQIAAHRAAEPARGLARLIEMPRHALPAGEEIAEDPEHEAEIE